MNKLLIDTDILIDYINHKEQAIDIIDQHINKTPVALSILSITELRSGWNEKQAQYYLPAIYDIFSIENVNIAIAEQAGKWRNEYKPRGIALKTVDAMIASTAFLHNYCLVTNNIKDYPMPELLLYKEKNREYPDL